jgi:hypothetical protein
VIVALASIMLFVALATADFTDNQLDEMRPKSSTGRRRPINRCRGCPSDECQVMGKCNCSVSHSDTVHTS